MKIKSNARAFGGYTLCLLLIAGSVIFAGCESAPPVRESTGGANASNGPLEIEWGGVPSSWNSTAPASKPAKSEQ